ncbi:MAG: hypothetical protein COB53_06235 [Elusimicrobia bacterium]|nr:MAG: hypothetical protein COB53_06235 [Elusimicrobiota bacterium]
MARIGWIAALLAVLAAGTWLRWNAATRAGSAFLDVDEPIYLNIGINAARLGVLGPEPAIPSPGRMPAGPAWIALSQFGKGAADPLRARHLQAVIAGLGVFVFFLFGIFLDEKRRAAVGILAAALYALHPGLIETTAIIRTEWLDVILTALVALFSIAWWRNPDSRSAFCFGLALGGALMSRSFLFLLVPVVILAAVLKRRRSLSLFILGVLIPLSPWMARNAVQFRAFIPFERGAAEPSLYYSSLGLPGSKGLSEYEAMAVEAHPALAALDTVARKKALGSLARRNIIKQPQRFLNGALKRFPVIWSGHLWLLLFGFIGFCLARRRVEAKILAGLWVYYNLHVFVDIHLMRLYPGIVPLLGLCVLGLLEIPGFSKRIPPPALSDSLQRWGMAALLTLLIPGFFFLAREASWVARVNTPEAKVFLDRIVLDPNAGLPLLDENAEKYPSFAALHVTHASLLLGAGRSVEACASLRKAHRIIAPLGAAGGELGSRISTSLSACN